MTSEPSCYYASCNGTPKWAVTSMTRTKQPDGNPLKLYTCDNHYTNLTSDLRKAVTRYTLEPIGGPHMVAPTTPEEDFKDLVKDRSTFYKVFTCAAVIVVGVVIGPPMFVYYGVKWLGTSILSRLGWKGQARNG